MLDSQTWTVQAGLNTPGKRLQWAIDRQSPVGRQRGLRMFERAMRARAVHVHGGITGATLPSISAYLKDIAEPSRAFYEAAGAVLDVRAEWLDYGTGTPTEEIAIAAGISASAQPGTGDWQRARALRLKRAILKAIGIPKSVPPPAHWLSQEEGGVELPDRRPELEAVPHWVAPLGEVWLRLHHRDMLLRDPVELLTAAHTGDDSAERDAARRVGKALRGPLEALGIDATQMHEEALGDYVSAMVPALFALITERSRQRARLLATGKHEKDENAPAAPSRRKPAIVRKPRHKAKPTKRRKS